MINNMTNNWKPPVRIHRKMFPEMLTQLHYHIKDSQIVVEDFKVHFILDGVVGTNQADSLATGHPDIHSDILRQIYQELYKHIKDGSIN